jgi:6-phosphogluconate dehydrogenase
MELGMIGLGRMGNNMVRRLMKAGHHCVVYDIHADAVQSIAKEGAVGSNSLEDFVKKLKTTMWSSMAVTRIIATTFSAPRN